MIFTSIKKFLPVPLKICFIKYRYPPNFLVFGPNFVKAFENMFFLPGPGSVVKKIWIRIRKKTFKDQKHW